MWQFVSLWLAAPPFPALWEDWGGISREEGGWYDGTKWALLLLLSAATNYQTTNPELLCTQLSTVLYVCFVNSMINPENDWFNTNGHFISFKLLQGDKKLWIYI